MSITENIRAYHGLISGGVPWRYRSWEHCYRFFRDSHVHGVSGRRDLAALQLGFYLASWGMYRGSSHLLKYDYTVHLPVVDNLVDPALAPLWERDVGTRGDDSALSPLILAAANAVREGYRPYFKPTDTLVTKVLLGTVGCLPACDRLFIDGFTSAGHSYSHLNAKFVARAIAFCQTNVDELRREQAKLAELGGPPYPLMKLMDMHFWQIGYDRWAAGRGTDVTDGPLPD